MHPTKNTLPEEKRVQICDILNNVLACCLDTFLDTKQAHWNVKGPHFIALHKLFDEVFENLEESTDNVAERIVQLGGVAKGTSQVVAKHSKVKPYPLEISAGLDHVRALSDSLATFGKVVREGIDKCDELGDADATDILTEVSRGVDKYLWFVEAHLDGKN